MLRTGFEYQAKGLAPDLLVILMNQKQDQPRHQRESAVDSRERGLIGTINDYRADRGAS